MRFNISFLNKFNQKAPSYDEAQKRNEGRIKYILVVYFKL